MNRASPIVLPLSLLGNLIAAPAAGCAEPAAAIAALPLKRGYYVASDTPCDEASNATVALVRRNGIGGSRDFCEFIAIVPTGPATYRVIQTCRELQSDALPETVVVTYVLSGHNRFTSRRADGWTYSARHCEQSRMGPAWRENDISDLIDGFQP